MPRLRLIFAALLSALLLSSCGRGRVIPPGAFAAVYADMFLADQWIRENPGERSRADTTYFYGAVLKRHGYRVRDYDRSVRHYLDNPAAYSKILEHSSEILKKRANTLELKRDALARERAGNLVVIPEKGLWKILEAQKDSLLMTIDTKNDDELHQ